MRLCRIVESKVGRRSRALGGATDMEHGKMDSCEAAQEVVWLH
jgi:hypothetical protein